MKRFSGLISLVLSCIMTASCEKGNHWRDYHFAAHRDPMTITAVDGKHLDVTELNRMYSDRELRTGDTILLKGNIPWYFDYRGCSGILIGNVNCTWETDAAVDSIFEHRVSDTIYLTGVLGIDYPLFSDGDISFTLFVFDNQTIYIANDENKGY